jgi:SAM-dependent methyltransferase
MRPDDERRAVAEPNVAQREHWNGENALRWVADADRRDRVLRPVLDLLLHRADLRPGEHVIDIGCGCGVTTVAAHAAVAPGTVVGLDISAPMLEVARRRTAAIAGISFVEADAQTHRFAPTFDVAVGRFGTMFFDEPIAAHTNLRTAMRRGGRLCLATWQPLLANDWLMIPGDVLLRHGSLPQVDAGPGMFAQSDPTEVTRVLTAAGWSDIAVEAIRVELPLGHDPVDAMEYLADTGIARRVLETIPDERRATALVEVVETLEAHRSEDGVRLGAGVYVITARAG